MIDTRVRTMAAAAAGAFLLMGLCASPAYAEEGAVAVDPAPLSTTEPTQAAPEAAAEPSESLAGVAPAVVSGTESFTVSPKGPWTKGQKVSVNFKGWTPGQLVVALTCPKGVWPAANPPGAGCAPFTDPSKGSNIGNIKPDGTLSLEITVQEGALAGTSKSCTTATPCTIGAYGTDEDATPAQSPPLVTIAYAGASGGSSGGSSTGTPTSSNSSSGGSSTGGSTAGGTASGSSTSGGAELANTGSSSTTSLALMGLAVVLLGGVMAAGSRIPVRRLDA